VIAMQGLITQIWRQLGEQWDALRSVTGFSAPLANLPAWMAPGLALAALLALAVTAGVALVSLGALLTALLVAYLLLDRVFGIEVAVALPR
jgi:hypothetical protein